MHWQMLLSYALKVFTTFIMYSLNLIEIKLVLYLFFISKYMFLL